MIKHEIIIKLKVLELVDNSFLSFVWRVALVEQMLWSITAKDVDLYFSEQKQVNVWVLYKIKFIETLEYQ